ncbi:MAG: ORF6N domain-containing protein [Bacteroidota bacterium]
MDTDLARLYEIPTFRLNEAVKRNQARFPGDFLFRLTKDELDSLTSQTAMSKKGRGGRRTLPYAFTEHGAVMAANILNSERAVHMSIFVVRAFIKMRQTLATTRLLTDRLNELEKKLTGKLDVHEKAIVYVLGELKKLMLRELRQILKGWSLCKNPKCHSERSEESRISFPETRFLLPSVVGMTLFGSLKREATKQS